jgi:hypothetical protein
MLLLAERAALHVVAFQICGPGSVLAVETGDIAIVLVVSAVIIQTVAAFRDDTVIETARAAQLIDIIGLDIPPALVGKIRRDVVIAVVALLIPLFHTITAFGGSRRGSRRIRDTGFVFLIPMRAGTAFARMKICKTSVIIAKLSGVRCTRQTVCTGLVDGIGIRIKLFLCRRGGSGPRHRPDRIERIVSVVLIVLAATLGNIVQDISSGCAEFSALQFAVCIPFCAIMRIRIDFVITWACFLVITVITVATIETLSIPAAVACA